MQNRDLMTAKELAERWSCSVGWLANQRCRGEGPTYLKLGAKVVYRMSDVLAYEGSATVLGTAA